MALFKVNTSRLDPYKNFRFKVIIDGTTVAGIQKVSALTLLDEGAADIKSAGDNETVYKLPGRTKWSAITLEQGLAHDDTFEKWVEMVHKRTEPDGEFNFRKDIKIQLLNESGVVALSYNVFRCWPSEYTAMPALDAGGHGMAISTLKLEHEGWERDTDVPEPPAETP